MQRSPTAGRDLLTYRIGAALAAGGVFWYVWFSPAESSAGSVGLLSLGIGLWTIMMVREKQQRIEIERLGEEIAKIRGQSSDRPPEVGVPAHS